MVEIEKLKEKIKPLAEQANLSLVVLFGSRATGQSHAHSDYDIAFLAPGSFPFDDENNLAVKIMGVIKSPHLDLTSIRRSPPLLKREIAATGIPLYEKQPGLFSDFIAGAYREFEEAKPLFDARRDYLREVIAGYKKELNYVR